MQRGIKQKRATPEDDEQMALFEWRDTVVARDERLRLLFHVPNGGHRHVSVAVRLKKMGVKSGVYDLFLPVPCMQYCGLWIEMKAGKNGLTKEQKDWKRAMTEQGYLCMEAWEWPIAARAICRYLGLKAEDFGV